MPLQTLEETEGLAYTIKQKEKKIGELLGCEDELLRTASGLKRNPEDAEDLVSRTYLKAISAIDSFETGTNARAWLYRIMINTHYSECRKKAEIPFCELNNFSIESIATGDTTEQEILSRHINSHLAFAIKNLPEEHRAVFVAYALSGHQYNELSRKFDIPVGTVKSRISRARKILASNPDVMALAGHNN